MHGLLVIGCGNMAKVHCRQLMEVDGLKLISAVDTLPERAEKFKTDYNFERCGIDYQEELKSNDFDIVLVSTTWQPRFKIIRDCLNAGKHVLAEKPLSLYLDEVSELTRIAKEKKLKLRIGYILRASAVIRRGEELIRGGVIGKVKTFSIVHHQRGLGSDWMIVKNLLKGGVTPGIDCGIHIYDLVCHWFDTAPDTVYCSNLKLNPDSEGDNLSHAVLKLESGITAIVEECYSPNVKKYFRLAVYGDEGSIFLDFTPASEPDTITIINKDASEESVEEVPVEGKATGRQMAEFMLDIDEDKDLNRHHESVYSSTEAALATILSSKYNEVIKLPLSNDQIKDAKTLIER